MRDVGDSYVETLVYNSGRGIHLNRSSSPETRKCYTDRLLWYQEALSSFPFMEQLNSSLATRAGPDIKLWERAV